MEKRTLILAGYGNMGRALCAGWLREKIMESQNIYIIEPVAPLRSQAQEAGFHSFSQLEEVPENIKPDYVVLAIKPQIFNDVIPAYARFAATATFISILAGVPIAKFADFFGKKAAIVRTIPNMPAAIGEGMLAFCDNGQVQTDSLHFVERLLMANGAITRVAESQMDAVTALSGSGPAYVFYLIECLAKAGEAVGLEPETALLLARQTVKGAGLQAALADIPPTRLREQVTSPGGTTQAGLAILMKESAMEKMMVDCLKAAHARSIALGQ